MYWVVHARRPRDFPRPERCPKGEARGTSRGPGEILRSEGMYSLIHPDSRQCTAILSSLHQRSDRVAKLNQKAKGTHELRNHNKINFKTPQTCFRLGMDSKHSLRHRRFIKVQNFCTFFWNISKTTTHPPTYATSAFYTHAGLHFT